MFDFLKRIFPFLNPEPNYPNPDYESPEDAELRHQNEDWVRHKIKMRRRRLESRMRRDRAFSRRESGNPIDDIKQEAEYLKTSELNEALKAVERAQAKVKEYTSWARGAHAGSHNRATLEEREKALAEAWDRYNSLANPKKQDANVSLKGRLTDGASKGKTAPERLQQKTIEKER